MARVRLVTTSEAEGDARQLFTALERQGAAILNLHRAIGNSPTILRNFLRLGTSLLGFGQLPPNLRELAILRIAQMTGADYEWAHHVPLAKQAGVSEEQIKSLKKWEAHDCFDDRARALLLYVETVTREVAVPGDVFNAARAYLSEGGIVELTLVCGYWGMAARILKALDIDVEPDVQQYLPA
jgi:AhpD family alkylhydroperoxidase